MLAPQIEKFYFELANPLVTSALAWFTSASPPTLFPVGSWPTPTATSRTTAKSTPSAAT
jgi:hypothetical protein